MNKTELHFLFLFQVKALHPHKKPILTLPVAQKLSKEQMAVLNAVLSGKNVFFTGSAGIYTFSLVLSYKSVYFAQ